MARKQKSMEEQVEKTEVEVQEGEQLDLIDVTPENAPEIIKHAKLYKKSQKRRILALEEEISEKQALLALIKESHMPTLEGGKISFRCDGYTITVTPRDELIKIKDEEEE
jgi:hypothetical protein